MVSQNGCGAGETHFIIYLFEPDIHVDFVFYVPDDLPPAFGASYSVLWDNCGNLSSWAQKMNSAVLSEPDWANVDQEEERFWTWIYYAWCHVARGEYYDIASQFGFLRQIPHA